MFPVVVCLFGYLRPSVVLVTINSLVHTLGFHNDILQSSAFVRSICVVLGSIVDTHGTTVARDVCACVCVSAASDRRSERRRRSGVRRSVRMIDVSIYLSIDASHPHAA